jgi:CBS domain containing-hemolysin-like protein
MTELVLAVGLAVGISALCSLLEAILYSLPISTIDVMERAGKSWGRIFKNMRSDIKKPITAILTLNTIANTAGAAIAGGAAIAVFGHRWLWVFTTVFTCSILMFSEIIPKTVGVVFNRTLAAPTAHILRVIVLVLKPLVWLINGFTSVITPSSSAATRISPQEIASMARMGRKSGSIELLEEKVIQNVLELDNKSAEDIMTPRTVVFSLSADLTLEEAHEKARGWPNSRVPVYDEDPEDIVGMILRRDVFAALCEGKGNIKLSELMRAVDFVPETINGDKLLIMFLEKRQHLFVVVDEYGGMARSSARRLWMRRTGPWICASWRVCAGERWERPNPNI